MVVGRPAARCRRTGESAVDRPRLGEQPVEAGSEFASRGICRSQSPTRSKRTIAWISCSGGGPGPRRRAAPPRGRSRRTGGCRASRRRSKSRSPRASSASKSDQLHRRPVEAVRQRACELEHHRDPRGAVVGADEAGDRSWCRSGRRPRPSPARSRDRPDHVSHGHWMTTSSTPASRMRSAISAAVSRLAAEPAGRGPNSTWASRSAKARSPSNRPGSPARCPSPPQPASSDGGEEADGEATHRRVS